MDKEQVAAVLTEIGTLLELKGENPFKTRAYHNAARTLEGLAEPPDKIVAEERLGEMKGFGDALVDKITKLVTTGKLPYYDDLKSGGEEGEPQCGGRGAVIHSCRSRSLPPRWGSVGALPPRACALGYSLPLLRSWEN